MKNKKGLRFALVLAACAVLLLQGCSQEEKEMEGKVKIISYNVLVEWCTEYNGANTGVTKTYDLTSRLEDLSELLKKEKPDSFGVQECSYAIKQHLLHNLTNYGCVGVMDTGGADDANAFGTFIFYNKEKYSVVETENFWLSTTPDQVSTYPGADRPRNGCWAIFENLETGEQYAHVNVHVEWKTKQSNSYGAEYTRQMVDELAARGLPVFCTGDFNVDSDDYIAVEIMTEEGAASVKDAQEIAKESEDSHSTHFDVPARKLDYCFVTDEKIDVERYELIGDYTISDHLGVKVVAALK